MSIKPHPNLSKKFGETWAGPLGSPPPTISVITISRLRETVILGKHILSTSTQSLYRCAWTQTSVFDIAYKDAGWHSFTYFRNFEKIFGLEPLQGLYVDL
jgi:hypothetical protein